MALDIESPEVDALARQLAELTGETLTQAVTRALAERLARYDRATGLGLTLALREIRERVTALPDARRDDDVLGYGPDGHFD